MRIVEILMQLLQSAFLHLIARVFAKDGLEAFSPLIMYFFVVLCTRVTEVIFIYPTLRILSGLNPIIFLRKFSDKR